jgi:hypothetical protein
MMHIVSLELCLTEGLECPAGYEVEIDEDDMLRMDKSALYTALGEGVKNGLLASRTKVAKEIGPSARARAATTPYLQQQNFSLAALDKRDSKADPFAATPGTAPAPTSCTDTSADAGAAEVRLPKSHWNSWTKSSPAGQGHFRPLLEHDRGCRMLDAKALAATLLQTVRAWVEPAFKAMDARIARARAARRCAGTQGRPGRARHRR